MSTNGSTAAGCCCGCAAFRASVGRTAAVPAVASQTRALAVRRASTVPAVGAHPSMRDTPAPPQPRSCADDRGGISCQTWQQDKRTATCPAALSPTTNYNLTPGQELLFACRYRLGTASNFVVYLRPIARQLRRRPGRLEHGQDVLHSAFERSCEAALWCALLGAGPAQPDGRNAGRLRPQILDATLEADNTEEEDEFLDGGATTWGKVLLEPTLITLGNFLLRSNSQSSVASASFAVGWARPPTW